MSATTRLARNTIYGFSAYAISAVVSFFSLPFLLRAFGSSVYGVFALASSIVALVALLDFGLTTVLTKNIAQIDYSRNSEALKEQVIVGGFWFCGIGILSCITILGCAHIPALFPFLNPIEFQLLHDVLVLHAFAQLVLWPLKIGSIILAGRQQYGVLAVSNSVVAVLSGLAIVLVLLINRGPLVLVAATLCISVLSSIALFVYAALSNKGLIKSHFNTRVIGAQSKRLFRLALPLFIAQIATFLMQQQADRLLLGVLLGATAVALYEIAAKLSSLVLQILTLAVSAIPPFIANLDADRPHKEMAHLLVDYSRYLALLLMPIIAVSFVLTKDIVFVWIGTGHEQEIAAARFLIASIFLHPTILIAESILVARDIYGTWLRYVLLAVVINLGVSLSLIGRLGIVGVAIGTLVAGVFEAVTLAWFSRVHLGLPLRRWLSHTVLPALFASAIAALTAYALAHIVNPLNIAFLFLTILASLLVAYLLVFFACFSPDERQRIPKQVLYIMNPRSIRST